MAKIYGTPVFLSGGGGQNLTLPPMVTNLAASTGDQTITLTWTNPVSDVLAGILVVYNTEHIPEKVSDGTKVDAGLAETVDLTGLTNETLYYIRVFPYNEKKQYQTMLEGATVTATPDDFPAEPTEYTEIEKIYDTREWEAPENGWFKFIIASKGGRGGTSYCSSWGNSESIYFGAGGGSPGCAVSEIAMNKGEKMLLTVSATDITCSVKDVQMMSTGGKDGGNPTSNQNNNGGDGGTATGGNKSNHNGMKGVSTGNIEQSGGYPGSSVAGRSGGNLQVEGYSFYGGTGGGGTRLLFGNRYVWGEQMPPTNGSTAVCIVLRGNTNIPAPSQASTLSLLPTDSTLTVDWANSGDPVQTGTMLVYNTNHAPMSENDGVSVDIPAAQAAATTFAVDREEQQADNKKQSYTITGLSNDKPVYVALFPYDANKKYGIPKTDVEIPRAHSWYDAQQELKQEVQEAEQQVEATEEQVEKAEAKAQEAIEQAEQVQEAVTMTRDFLPDAIAFTTPQIYDEWNPSGIAYTGKNKATESSPANIVRYQDRLYRCLQSHTSQADWNPCRRYISLGGNCRPCRGMARMETTNWSTRRL